MDRKLTELFIIGIGRLLGEGKIDVATRTTNILLDSVGWGIQTRIKKDHVTMSWFSEECRQGKEEALRALRKWKSEKTKVNRCKYVEKRIQYEVIIENEKKKWQEWNSANIKRQVDKKDNAQIWRGIRNQT
jgi:hypothetical protein